MSTLEENKKRTYDWLHDNMPISYPHLTDEEMAGKVRMLFRTDLDHEAVVCGARDRIMCLVKEKAALIEENKKLLAQIEALTAYKGMQETTNDAVEKWNGKGPHPSHITRASDASTFDEICVKCGATDQVPGGWGKLAEPCPKAGE